MTTILVYHLLQAYTWGILREQRKVQHLVQLDQYLLTDLPTGDTLIFSRSNAKRANALSTQPPLHQHHRMLCFFHMATGGIDASLPRPSCSGFGSSDHALICLPDARPNGAYSSVCLSAFEHPHRIACLRLGSRRPVGDHRCPWMASASLEPEIESREADVSSCLSRTSADGQVVSLSLRVRRR